MNEEVYGYEEDDLEEDDLSCYAANEEVYGYENDVLDEVEYSESSQSAPLSTHTRCFNVHLQLSAPLVVFKLCAVLTKVA